MRHVTLRLGAFVCRAPTVFCWTRVISHSIDRTGRRGVAHAKYRRRHETSFCRAFPGRRKALLAWHSSLREHSDAHLTRVSALPTSGRRQAHVDGHGGCHDQSVIKRVLGVPVAHTLSHVVDLFTPATPRRTIRTPLSRHHGRSRRFFRQERP